VAEKKPTDKRGPAIPGGGKRMNRDTRKEARRAAAEAREADRKARSDKEQIARLDALGHAATKERKRLNG
jgi:hypothetical protein